MKTDDTQITAKPAEEPSPSGSTEKYSINVKKRGLIGIAIFAVWLILFFLGMSVPSSKLHPFSVDATGSISAVVWDNLVLYALTFTPTNTALLAALSGVLGGLASNLSAHNEKKYVKSHELDAESFEYRSFIYMTEHPVVSMFRGFVAYLILVAGSYLASFSIPTDDASTILGMSPSSYFKFAVTVSLLSYLVGYDPTQLQRLISSLNVGGRKGTDFEGRVSIKDGRRQMEGEFKGKAVPADSVSDAPPATIEAETEEEKPALNGKAKKELV